MRWLWLPLTVIGIALIAWGVHVGQDHMVARYAKALCTACIGLE